MYWRLVLLVVLSVLSAMGVSAYWAGPYHTNQYVVSPVILHHHGGYGGAWFRPIGYYASGTTGTQGYLYHSRTYTNPGAWVRGYRWSPPPQPYWQWGSARWGLR